MYETMVTGEDISQGNIELCADISLKYKINHKNNTCNLILQRKNESFDLSSLLPPDHHFEAIFDATGTFFYDGEKRIMIDLGSIQKDKREFFAILHEIGHAVTFNKRGPEYAEKVLTTTKWPENRAGYDLDVSDERSAWAEAHKIARMLRSHGFDLFKLFENNNDLFGWLRATGLADTELHEEYKTRPSKEWLVDLFRENEAQQQNKQEA